MYLPINILKNIHYYCSIDVRRILETLLDIPTICYPLDDMYERQFLSEVMQPFKFDGDDAYDVWLLTPNQARCLYILSFDGSKHSFTVYHRTPIKLESYIGCNHCVKYRKYAYEPNFPDCECLTDHQPT